ncbi:hypothetical protein F7725_016441 [Dissostichus mawsoni]|uniref:Immunoglobulin V-set domain-containing protein n=1 Tax=Dissostichus mawsoni TaxID=36200 RepID=A0A7J5Z5W5_DISMA|nr:hypothetical protein F7725_016441 [Dissostichus mawsoni]
MWKERVHSRLQSQVVLQRERSICEDILSTKSALRSNGMFTLTETESGITVSISNVSPQHAGVYWCGVESTEGSYRGALRKIQLEVKATADLTRLLSYRHPWFICVAALQLLLFVLIFILIYKRLYLRGDAGAPPDARLRNTITTIYSTANFPTNPSASLRYSTINFRNVSGEAAEVLMTNPSSSACDYSAVKDRQIPTCSNVNQPSPEDPLYSNVVSLVMW